EVETLDIHSFVEALEAGVKTAYKAVMKPVEGTILTVAKDSAQKAVDSVDSVTDIRELMKIVVEESKASLKRTPDLLSVLKEVGVVDSGGQGLVYVYEGFLSALTGEEIEADESQESALLNADSHDHNDDFDDFMSVDDIEFGYCTEFMVR